MKRREDLAGGIDFFETIRRYEIELIRQALEQANGNQARAARMLKLSTSTLHAKIKSYNIRIKFLSQLEPERTH